MSGHGIAAEEMDGFQIKSFEQAMQEEEMYKGVKALSDNIHIPTKKETKKILEEDRRIRQLEENIYLEDATTYQPRHELAE